MKSFLVYEREPSTMTDVPDLKLFAPAVVRSSSEREAVFSYLGNRYDFNRHHVRAEALCVGNDLFWNCTATGCGWDGRTTREHELIAVATPEGWACLRIANADQN